MERSTVQSCLAAPSPSAYLGPGNQPGIAIIPRGSQVRACSPRQCHFPERLDQRSLQLALHAAEDLVGVLPGHWRPVWPGLDQRGKDIRDRQQSDQIGNLRARQSIRIAGAIKIFVMVPHAIQNFRTDARYALQQIISDRGMTPDDLLLLGVEASRLVQYRQRNTRLADVVEGCRYSEPRDVPAGESDIQPEGDRNTGHKQAVLKRALMLATQPVEPRRKPVLPDAGDNLRRC